MATLDDYINVAPTVMSIGDFTLTQIENKIDRIPDPPPPIPDPPITEAKIIGLFNAIFDTYSPSRALKEAGGYEGLAREANLTKDQVKLIVRELKAMVSIRRSEQS